MLAWRWNKRRKWVGVDGSWRFAAYRIFKHARHHLENRGERKVVHVLVVRSDFADGLLPVVVVLFQRVAEPPQAFDVQVEEAVVAEDDRQAAGELRNAKRVDGNVLVVHDQHDENERSDEDVKRVEDNFELNEAENLSDERGRFGGELTDAGENHCVTAELVSALVHLVDRRQHVQPYVETRQWENAADRHRDPNLIH